MRNEANCSECGRPIKAWRPGARKQVHKPKADHDLCQRCWQAEQDRNHGEKKS